jgi:hypothetical protein
MIRATLNEPQNPATVTPSVTRFARRHPPAVALAQPETFVVVASRIVSDDVLVVELRGEHVGTLAGAKRHAVALAQAVAERFGVAACCDVQSIDGLPLFSIAVVAEVRR